jgi:SpoVK/Ycf46/Vps4 family AAA+-type ATPase
MQGHQHVDTTGLDAEYLPVLRLWMLRALMRCNGVRNFVRENRFQDDNIARLIGYTDKELENYSQAWALKSLARRLAVAEAQPAALPQAPALARNVARLAERLSLNAVERDILHFTALQRVHSEFGELLGSVGELTRASLCRLLAECLTVPVRDVQAALDDRGKLCRSALLSVDDARAFTFDCKVDVLAGLPESLMLEHDDLLGLFGQSLVRSPAPRLTLDDYPHLSDDIAILRSYLGGSCRQRRPGVNVLVHGRPGTGKTEFARALTDALSLTLLEIPTEEPSGRPRAGKDRFESLRFAQSLLAGSDQHVLLFDEVEDVFSRGRAEWRGEGNGSGMKGWVNQMLERNPVPTFWITNHLGDIDPAYRRRFDFVLHLDVPPASVRRRVIDRHFADLAVPETWRSRLARHDDAVPAVVERAARVGALVCSLEPAVAPEHVLTRVVNHTLVALGAARLADFDGECVGGYRLDLLNADCDLERLREGLRQVGDGRLCLYGPPGTGKSALGRHLAESLGRPLQVRRASDILSPYVGEAERNIAAMFGQARRDGAVLLLDEADSLLRDRKGAQRTWEVTQVNEMLTQMEAFRGIFVASTNLMDSLDEAAMRRFDACIRLGYLGPRQAWDMFAALATSLGLAVPEALRSRLDALSMLTPGDFAAVSRGARFNAASSAQDLLARLIKVCDAKNERRQRPIGFVTPA